MKIMNLLALAGLVALTACGDKGGEAGDTCASDDDCAEGLECHIEEHDDEHEEEEEEGEEHAEEGVCEEAGHEDHDH